MRAVGEDAGADYAAHLRNRFGKRGEGYAQFEAGHISERHLKALEAAEIIAFAQKRGELHPSIPCIVSDKPIETLGDVGKAASTAGLTVSATNAEKAAYSTRSVCSDSTCSVSATKWLNSQRLFTADARVLRVCGFLLVRQAHRTRRC